MKWGLLWGAAANRAGAEPSLSPASAWERWQGWKSGGDRQLLLRISCHFLRHSETEGKYWEILAYNKIKALLKTEKKDCYKEGLLTQGLEWMIKFLAFFIAYCYQLHLYCSAFVFPPPSLRVRSISYLINTGSAVIILTQSQQYLLKNAHKNTAMVCLPWGSWGWSLSDPFEWCFWTAAPAPEGLVPKQQRKKEFSLCFSLGYFFYVLSGMQGGFPEKQCHCYGEITHWC